MMMRMVEFKKRGSTTNRLAVEIRSISDLEEMIARNKMSVDTPDRDKVVGALEKGKIVYIYLFPDDHCPSLYCRYVFDDSSIEWTILKVGPMMPLRPRWVEYGRETDGS